MSNFFLMKVASFSFKYKIIRHHNSQVGTNHYLSRQEVHLLENMHFMLIGYHCLNIYFIKWFMSASTVSIFNIQSIIYNTMVQFQSGQSFCLYSSFSSKKSMLVNFFQTVKNDQFQFKSFLVSFFLLHINNTFIIRTSHEYLGS